MRIARAFGCLATVLTGFALVAWVALAALTTVGGLDLLGDADSLAERLDPNLFDDEQGASRQ